jgi:hypothetical protein
LGLPELYAHLINLLGWIRVAPHVNYFDPAHAFADDSPCTLMHLHGALLPCFADYSWPQTSETCSSVPFHVPAVNKSAQSTSPSRLSHGYTCSRTGFREPATLKDLAFSKYDYSLATFVFDAWALNSGMRGPRDGCLGQIGTLQDAAVHWMQTAGAGVA